MRLGTSSPLGHDTAINWAKNQIKIGCSSVVFPVDSSEQEEKITEYKNAADKAGLMIAEDGIWRNALSLDQNERRKNMDYCVEQLRMADFIGAKCCVNVSGAFGKRWDGAYKENFSKQAREEIIRMVREIIDRADVKNTFFALEPMPWMIPDSPEVYLQLMRDVDREQFAVHMDFVNMINCPRRFLDAEGFIEECFSRLGPYIKSTHLKDSRMDPMQLTTVLHECSPGEGSLDFVHVLRIIDRYLPADAPVLLEHMTTFEEYRRAYDYVAAKAAEAGVGV